MIELYNKNALECSRLTTQNFSTSFSIGVRLLHKKFRTPIHAIYGFVRFADEIVDTFFDQDQQYWLEKFKNDTHEAIDKGYSPNPILHSFQLVVNRYQIPYDLIDSFLHSMEMDLHRTEYDPGGFQKYVYGSAEVVGLMCLKIFTDEEKNYDEFVYSARKLGEAFQKINFLRDLKDDFHERGRSYFPHVDMSQFSEEVKKELEADIQYDFDEALTGIKRLNPDARFGVYIAYYYYTRLFRKIRKVSAQDLLQHRYRIPNIKKFYLVFEAYIRYTLRIY